MSECEKLMRAMEAEINRLRAVSGDLLAALEQLLRRAEQLDSEGTGPCPSCEKARSAIAKAKVGQP